MAEKIKVLGVDISTKKISAVCMDEEAIPFAVFEHEQPGKTADVRFSGLVVNFLWLVEQLDPDVIYVEGLPFVKSRAGVVSIASILGAVRTVSTICEIRCVVVPGYTWKKEIGTGVKKEAIAQWVEIDSGEYFKHLVSQDLMDAYAISKYGLKMENA